MKYLKYILGLALILFVIPSIAQDAKIEKKTEAVVSPPPPTIVNDADLSGTPPLPVGDRIVFWVHGLGGDVYSWDRASENIGDVYKVTSLSNPLDYSPYSLSGAGQILQNTIDGQSFTYSEDLGIEDPGNMNFIIAHSQGGLVSRAAYKRYDSLDFVDERTFGGIVTFGTPHQGAQILNNVPLFLEFIDSSCVTLAEGPALEAWYGNWILSFFPADGMIDKLETICYNFSSKIVPLMMADYLTPITNDYNVGTDYLEDLNQFDSEMDQTDDAWIPKVAYYGVEEDPIVWRTVYSILNDVNDEEAFQANSDDGLISIANANQNSYYLKYLAYSNLYDLTSVNCQDIIGYEAWLLGWNLYACNPENLNYEYNDYGYLISNNVTWWPYSVSETQEVRDAYYTGYQWWTDVEETYLSLIGAVDYGITGCHCDCEIKFGSDNSPIQVLFNIDCNDDCSGIVNDPPDNANILSCEYAVVYETYIKPNDGVVLQESAQNYPGADNGMDNIMTNTNHLQMRNNFKTQLKLESLMNGYDGLFFETDERE